MRFLHHEMLFIQVVCTFLIAAVSSVVAIDCFECTNATTIEECKSIITCNTGEICFADYLPTGNQTLYSFGCRSEGTCKKETQSTNEGSDSLGGGSTSCSQCCKEHHCNRQLCQDLFRESDCSDSKRIDCFTLEQLANICLDTARAKSVCRRLCGLCSYEDGHWAAWSTWSVCDVTCGDGHQTRARTCTEPAPSGGGNVCQGSSGDTQTCTLQPCPVHGHWAQWGPWGTCSATCGIGMQRKDRTCSNPYPARFGNHCFGDSKDDRLCVLAVCPVTNGGWGAWTVWTQCSVSCNGGIQQRQRQCNNPKPSADGDYCGDSASDVQMCSIEKCPRRKAAFLARHASRLSIGLLQFSTVILNEGTVFDSFTGVFTCPFPGLYTFTASIIEHGDGNNYIGCSIRKLATHLVNMYFRQGKIDGKDASDGLGAASGTVTLHLVKGDRVYVSCKSDTGASLGGSSFTGFLISEDP